MREFLRMAALSSLILLVIWMVGTGIIEIGKTILGVLQ